MMHTVRLSLWLVCAMTVVGSIDANDQSIPANAAKGVGLIGSHRCAECHRDQYDSYIKTSHSKAARPTDVELEPKPARFDHPLSGNTYEVLVRDGAFVHREILRDLQGQQLAVTEKPMQVTLGSGAHAISYLFRDGPFHGESPITFFTDIQRWGMSPGYDEPVHRSFRRTVTVSCVFCHVGSIEQQQRNPYKFEIVEAAIGCERCHGPGQLHADRHKSDPDWRGEHDETIVNPSGLERELAEAICQQCHCQGVQAINLPDKNDWDYRPGLKLTDFRADFQFRRGDQSMRLVGHVEQMHSSPCYQQSESLTCVSCHDPHDPPPANDRVSYFRDKCYQCHQDDQCGVDRPTRDARHGNDCAACHMPAGETNVAHFALHDHRIGIHDQGETIDRSTDQAATFEPILDLSHLPAWQQRRLNALAKYEIHRRFGANPNFADFNIQATAELIQIKNAGQADPEVDAALVWLARDQGQAEIARRLANEIIAKTSDESMPRIVATHALAQYAFADRDFDTAVKLFRDLATLHRDGQDLYYLGLSEQNVKNTDQAIAALKRSIEIEPSQVASHAALAAIYASLNDLNQSEFHRRRAEQNAKLQEKYRRGFEAMKEKAAK